MLRKRWSLRDLVPFKIDWKNFDKDVDLDDNHAYSYAHPGRPAPLPPQTESDLRVACAAILRDIIPAEFLIDDDGPEHDPAETAEQADKVHDTISILHSKSNRISVGDFPLPDLATSTRYSYRPDATLEDLDLGQDMPPRYRKQSDGRSESFASRLTKSRERSRPSSQIISVTTNITTTNEAPNLKYTYRPKRESISEVDPEVETIEYSWSATGGQGQSIRGRRLLHRADTRAPRNSHIFQVAASYISGPPAAADSGRLRSDSQTTSISRGIQEVTEIIQTDSPEHSRSPTRAPSTRSGMSSASSGVIPKRASRFSFRNFRQSWSSWGNLSDEDGIARSDRSRARTDLHRRSGDANKRWSFTVNLNREPPPQSTLDPYKSDPDLYESASKQHIAKLWVRTQTAPSVSKSSRKDDLLSPDMPHLPPPTGALPASTLHSATTIKGRSDESAEPPAATSSGNSDSGGELREARSAPVPQVEPPDMASALKCVGTPSAMSTSNKVEQIAEPTASAFDSDSATSSAQTPVSAAPENSISLPETPACKATQIVSWPLSAPTTPSLDSIISTQTGTPKSISSATPKLRRKRVSSVQPVHADSHTDSVMEGQDIGMAPLTTTTSLDKLPSQSDSSKAWMTIANVATRVKPRLRGRTFSVNGSNYTKSTRTDAKRHSMLSMQASPSMKRENLDLRDVQPISSGCAMKPNPNRHSMLPRFQYIDCISQPAPELVSKRSSTYIVPNRTSRLLEVATPTRGLTVPSLPIPDIMVETPAGEKRRPSKIDLLSVQALSTDTMPPGPQHKSTPSVLASQQPTPRPSKDLPVPMLPIRKSIYRHADDISMLAASPRKIASSHGSIRTGSGNDEDDLSASNSRSSSSSKRKTSFWSLVASVGRAHPGRKPKTWMDKMEKMGVRDGVLITDDLTDAAPIVRY